jgi:predicted Rossmann fold nucleotide-binding protein DprA/Smf involved in DNA uptake
MIATGPYTMDHLGDRLQMPIAQLLQLVTTMECAGMITVLPGGTITRK